MVGLAKLAFHFCVGCRHVSMAAMVVSDQAGTAGSWQQPPTRTVALDRGHELVAAGAPADLLPAAHEKVKFHYF